MRLSEIASLLNGTLQGEDREVAGMATLEEAGPGDVSLCAGDRHLPALRATRAAAVLVQRSSAHLAAQAPCTVLLVDELRLALARLLDLFCPPSPPAPAVSPLAGIEPGARVPASCRVEAGAWVGSGAQLGERCHLQAHAVIGPGARLGDDCTIGSGAVIAAGCILGNRVRVGAGTVIGSEGFGVVLEDGRPRRIPSTGRVVIEDGVDIGANCTIARATLGVTRIGRFCHLDDQVHIAHNCLLEEGVIIAAQSGIAGSVHIGRGAVLGGQVGVADHVDIGAGAQVGARSAVAGHVPAGTQVAGYPAMPLDVWLGERVLLRRLRRWWRRRLERSQR